MHCNTCINGILCDPLIPPFGSLCGIPWVCASFQELEIKIVSDRDIFDDDTSDLTHSWPFIRRISVGEELYKLEATIPLVEDIVNDLLPYRDKARKRTVTDKNIIHEKLVYMEKTAMYKNQPF